MLSSHGLVHAPPRLLSHRLQLSRHAYALCRVLHDKSAVSGPSAVMGEPEEGECIWTPFATLSSRHGRHVNGGQDPRLFGGALKTGTNFAVELLAASVRSD